MLSGKKQSYVSLAWSLRFMGIILFVNFLYEDIDLTSDKYKNDFKLGS